MGEPAAIPAVGYGGSNLAPQLVPRPLTALLLPCHTAVGVPAALWYGGRCIFLVIVIFVFIIYFSKINQKYINKILPSSSSLGSSRATDTSLVPLAAAGSRYRRRRQAGRGDPRGGGRGDPEFPMAATGEGTISGRLQRRARPRQLQAHQHPAATKASKHCSRLGRRVNPRQQTASESTPRPRQANLKLGSRICSLASHS
jgi:hypothetical protein